MVPSREGDYFCTIVRACLNFDFETCLPTRQVRYRSFFADCDSKSGVWQGQTGIYITGPTQKSNDLAFGEESAEAMAPKEGHNKTEGLI